MSINNYILSAKNENSINLMSTARSAVQVFTTCDNPRSDTFEADISRISQELSANATRISSFSNFLLFAIATTVICQYFFPQYKQFDTHHTYTNTEVVKLEKYTITKAFL